MNQLLNTSRKPPESGGYVPSGQNDEKSPNSAKAAFVRQASHDIQGSFFGVSSLCKLIRGSKDNQENIDVLAEHLEVACNSYKHKLSNFLEYNRWEAGLQDTILERVNVRLLFDRIVTENHYAAFERKVNVKLFVTDKTPQEIVSDEFRIAQICNNLVTNAINFSPAASTVLVQVEYLDQESLEIVVEDEGEGMTAEQLNGLFKLSPTERKYLQNPGGLGLLIAKYLAEDILKGRILISSQPGIGTCCTVRLPLQGRSLNPGDDNNLIGQLQQIVTS